MARPGEHILAPHSPEAEISVLGAVLQDPEAAAAVTKVLQPSELFQDRHAQILSVVRALQLRNVTPDLVTVANELLERGQLEAVGGAEYLARLVDQVPTAANVLHHVAIVRKKAGLRHITDACTWAAQRAKANGTEPADIYAELWEKLRPVEPAPVAGAILLEPPWAVLRRLQDPAKPIPTGLPGLDARLRGGMRPGKAMIIGGTAGAGKTTLAQQIGLAGALAGCVVACLMVDEGRDPAVVRVGQQLGWEREQVEEGLEGIITGLERELAGRVLTFPDPDEEGATLDAVVEALVQAHPGRPALVVVDSVQTVRVRETGEEHRSLRERIIANARRARRLAREHGLVMILTSEVSRSWYRSRKEEDRAADLAAFAEARIEFVGDVLLTMRANDDDPDLVDVRIPKNRLGGPGGKAPLLLRLDRSRARFDEMAASSAQPARDAALGRKVEEAKQGILKALDEHKELNRSQLWDLVQGNREAFQEALRDLKTAGLILTEPSGRSMIYRRSVIPS